MGFAVLYTIRDGKNASSTMELNLPSAVSLAGAIEFAQDFAGLIDAVITGAISRIGLAFIVDLPGGLTAVPAATSDVEEGAKFQFATDGGFYTGFRVPTFDETFISAGSRDVNTAAGAVASLIAATTAGLTTAAGVVEPSDKREDDIAALTFAREQFLSSRGS